ncbi:uncharacterized protein PRCAT00004567001 [Priceomyces carsonii]|uniref:uncharacterized protein n=1 Tax=Priceomyces carsonii TaxID=28549 RepID=UPI002EDA41A9|nr:unnamed protein product [Priceomyces carsonii]
MEDADIYDEFGNIIGDPLDSDADSDSVDNEINDDEHHENNVVGEHDENSNNGALIRHNGEDNGGNLTLRQTYGTDVETILVRPYESISNEPVLEPIKDKRMKVEFTENEDSIQEKLPQLTYSRDYMISLMNSLPERIRNVAVVGNLHSGKTSFIDTLILQTHPSILSNFKAKQEKELRFLDNHKLEIERGITIKSSPITLLLPDFNDKSYILNVVDTPGHVDFHDEVSSALMASDGVFLVIDVVEGLTPRDKSIINEVLKNNLPLTVVFNKLDRLILELQLPPSDFYYKLKYELDDINSFIESNEYAMPYTHQKIISPTRGNVIFAFSKMEFSFTLISFAKLYSDNGFFEGIDIHDFSKRLWGEFYFDQESNKLIKSSNNGNLRRSFIHFIVEPLYKIISYTLTANNSGEKLNSLLWQNFKVLLLKRDLKLDSRELLNNAVKKIFPDCGGLVDVALKNIFSPIDTADSKCEVLYGLRIGENSDDSLIATILKSIESSDGLKFYSLVRVIQGKLKSGDTVKVLGDNFDNDAEDFKDESIENIYISGGRYKFPVKEAGPGSLVLVSGIGSIVNKSAAIFSPSSKVLKQLKSPNYSEKSVFKCAIEPANPSDLPKMLASLRKVKKSYLASEIKVEESGEHVILAPGELYLDCVLCDLRNFFSDNLEIKVSDPMTKFSETCLDISVTKIPTKSNDNVISIIAQPVSDLNLSHAIEARTIDLSQPIKTTSKLLRRDFGWDALAARSVWCFGPDDLKLPSILLDDTLEAETDKKLLYSVKDLVTLGFKWSVNEGPLCDEPIRNTKFKILDAVIGGSEIQRSGTQIIPLMRKACYTGFLTATPRLLEPIYAVYVTCKGPAISAISKLLDRRRGFVIKEEPVPGTPLFSIEGRLPVIESVGFESDVRLRTQGQAMCLLDFENWEVVPGDPLDRECYLPPLKPVPTKSLARDFVMKTRKRKGLAGEPSLQKYVEPELFEKLKANGLID